MGNSLGGTKTTKVMKINGETIKLKTPVQAREVVKDYPGYVLLESEAVKHFGIRAKPLEAHQELKAKRLYFLVELPKFQEERGARRVRSAIHMSAKDRLESLMLARRSISDLSLARPALSVVEEERKGDGVRMKMRLPKAEVERVMKECKNEAEAADKILKLCMGSNQVVAKGEEDSGLRKQVMWEHGSQGRVGEGFKTCRQKRVGFLPVNEGEIQLAMAS